MLKNFISVSGDELKTLDIGVYMKDVVMMKFESFKEAFDKLFPGGTNQNIGIRLKATSKNLFVNDFLYNILAETPNKYRNILRDYFKLNDDQELGVITLESNLIAIMEAEKLDLNSLFMKDIET